MTFKDLIGREVVVACISAEERIEHIHGILRDYRMGVLLLERNGDWVGIFQPITIFNAKDVSPAFSGRGN